MMNKINEELRFHVKNKPSDRIMSLVSGDIDQEKRTVCFTFSSDTPVLRTWGREILSHKPGAAKTDRMNKAGPLLLNHDEDLLIGAVLECAVIEGKGKAIAQFSRSKLGQEVFQDVIDGIRPNMSFRYKINEFEEIRNDQKDDIPTYLITDYEILEVSVVSIPADYSIGVGRSLFNPEEMRRKTVIEEQTITNDQKDVLSMERTRIKEINELARSFGKEDLASSFIERGESSDAFRKAILAEMVSSGHKHAKTIPAEVRNTESRNTESIENVRTSQTPFIPGLEGTEKRNFSLARAVVAKMTGSWQKAGYEKEIIDTVARSQSQFMGQTIMPNEFLVPLDMIGYRDERQNLFKATGEPTGGKTWVPEDLLGGSNFIDTLKSALFTMRLGCRFMTGLTSNISLTKKTGNVTAQWLPEGSPLDASMFKTEKVPMAPRRVGALVNVTNQYLMQALASLDVENLIVEDMTSQIAAALDDACLYGANYGPSGLLGTPGINKVVIPDGARSIEYADIVEMETKVNLANAHNGSVSYLTGPSVKGKLKTQPIAQNTPGFVWSTISPNNEMMNGYKCFSTNFVKNRTEGNKLLGTLIYGAWDNIIIGCWGYISFRVEQLPTSDSIRLVANQYYDIAIRHPEAFSICDTVPLNPTHHTPPATTRGARGE